MNPLKVLRLPVGQLQSNSYIVFDTKTNDSIVIDPGDDGQFIIQKLIDNNLTPLALIATHGHFDHVNAGLELELAYNISFYLNPNDFFFLKTNRQVTKRFTSADPGPAPHVELMPDKKITFGSLEFEIINTPGHTPGSVCFYNKTHKILFVGDLLFANGETGEWKHKYGSKEDLISSIKKILKLPKDTIVYAGHGEEATISELLVHPFLGVNNLIDNF